MSTIAFIFDMDGVIIDSNPFHKVALHQFCEKYGYHLTEEQLRNKIYGRTNKQWITNLFERELSPEELHEFAEEKEGLFRDLYQHDIKALAGLDQFLEKMNGQKLARAIGTSAPRSNVDFVMAKTNLSRYFPTILDDSFVEHGKPNPEIYLKCAAALGYQPNRCVVFEDSISGVTAGRAAGAKVVGVATTHTHKELAETDYIIDDFTDLDPAQLISILFKKPD
ncbi:MAG: HAD family phosphatase [Cyclobacteriaceae bacterium]|nr:HAD family phosphatase [Cyclobacteriaceae bacterium]